jgi:excisionase family DNA binding protein
MTATARVGKNLNVTKTTVTRVAYSVIEVAQMLGVSGSFVRLEIKRGRLEEFRAGRRVLVTKRSFDAYMAAGS